MEKIVSFPEVTPFDFIIRYEEADPKAPDSILDLHIHEECQIYINLTGDVEFIVENRLYPISTGSVVIVRPNEFHHCIYRNTNIIHKHFCIYFTPGGNENLLEPFFNRLSGQENLVTMTDDDFPLVKKVCFALLNAPSDPILQYCSFFELIALLKRGKVPDISNKKTAVPPDVQTALAYIYENLSFPITIAEIAKASHVSRNTLERHFLSAIQVTPSEFLKQRRLHHAKKLLQEGASVSEAGQKSGFSDCSYFISLFREKYGVTPLQFKKQRNYP